MAEEVGRHDEVGVRVSDLRTGGPGVEVTTAISSDEGREVLAKDDHRLRHPLKSSIQAFIRPKAFHNNPISMEFFLVMRSIIKVLAS